MQGLVKLVVVQCSFLRQEFILANGKIEFICQHISFHCIKLRLLVSVMWMFMCINFHISFHCLSIFTCLFCLFFLCVLERGIYLGLFICFLYLISKLIIAFFFPTDLVSVARERAQYYLRILSCEHGRSFNKNEERVFQ